MTRLRRLLLALVLSGTCTAASGQDLRVYLANDDHTDYFWTADDVAYRQAFLDMIDFYLQLKELTKDHPPEHQSRFNCDGSLWLWEYEQNKSTAEFAVLIEALRSGHFSAPMTALVSCYGGVPAEAVVRGMMYAGQLERRYGLDFDMAVSMENQTLPFGLPSLWAGSGAQYSWKGICDCVTKVPGVADREHEIYWATGPDGRRILMKWNSLLIDNKHMGGYAEARDPRGIVDFVSSDPTFQSKYPYSVIGCFGYGWDDFQSFTDLFVQAAQEKTNANRLVRVSNEEDFFRDFEATFGDAIPEVRRSFGNEWDLYCASLAEVTASVKRSLIRLRAGEALATTVAQVDPHFFDGRHEARDRAFMDFGLYWEHDWTADGPVGRDAREQFQRDTAGRIADYARTLERDASRALGRHIRLPAATTGRRAFAFNPLGHTRDDVAQLLWDGPLPEDGALHVVTAGQEQLVPSQIVVRGGRHWVEWLASDVPALGYRVYEIRGGAAPDTGVAGTYDPATQVLENDFHRLELTPRGAIVDWIDRTLSRSMAQSFGGRWINDLGGSGSGTITVESVGPVSITVRCTASQPLDHTTRITLYRDLPRIDIRNVITQNFSDVETYSFGFSLDDPLTRHEEVGAIATARYESAGGHYADEDARTDWLTMNHVVDVTAGAGDVGIWLSNRDASFFQLGNSTATSLDTNNAQIKALVGGQVDGRRFGIRDQGGDTRFEHHFALSGHAAAGPGAGMRFALEHQNPFIVGEVTGALATLPPRRSSLLAVQSPDVLAWAAKPAQEGLEHGLILRLWNVSDERTFARVQPRTADAQFVTETTHIETDFGGALPQSQRGAFVVGLEPQQLRTFRLRAGTPQR